MNSLPDAANIFEHLQRGIDYNLRASSAEKVLKIAERNWAFRAVIEPEIPILVRVARGWNSSSYSSSHPEEF